MNEKQRSYYKKINNGTLTETEYKEIDKKLYPLVTRIELMRKYKPILYYLIYIFWILFISIVVSVVVVNFAVQ